MNTPLARRSWPSHSSLTMALVQRYLMEVASGKVSFFRSYGYLSVKCIPGVNLHIVKFASCFPEILSPEIVFYPMSDI